MYLPYPLAVWSGAMYAGPVLAPVLSVFAVEAKGYVYPILGRFGEVFHNNYLVGAGL